MKLAVPSKEQWVRSTFWTLWSLTVLFTAYRYANYRGYWFPLGEYFEYASEFHPDDIASSYGSIASTAMLLLIFSMIGKYSRLELYLGSSGFCVGKAG